MYLECNQKREMKMCKNVGTETGGTVTSAHPRTNFGSGYIVWFGRRPSVGIGTNTQEIQGTNKVSL